MRQFPEHLMSGPGARYATNVRREPWRPEPTAAGAHPCQSGGPCQCGGKCGGPKAAAAEAPSVAAFKSDAVRRAEALRALRENPQLARLMAGIQDKLAVAESVPSTGWDWEISDAGRRPRVAFDLPPKGGSWWSWFPFLAMYGKFMDADCDKLRKLFTDSYDILAHEWIALLSRDCATVVTNTTDSQWLAIGAKCGLNCATGWHCKDLVSKLCGCKPMQQQDECIGSCIGEKYWDAWEANGGLNFQEADNPPCEIAKWVAVTKNFFPSRYCNRTVAKILFNVGGDAFVSSPIDKLGLSEKGDSSGSAMDSAYWTHRKALAWALLKKCKWTEGLYSCEGGAYNTVLAPIPPKEYPKIFCAGKCAPDFPVPLKVCNCWALNEIGQGNKEWFDIALSMC